MVFIIEDGKISGALDKDIDTDKNKYWALFLPGEVPEACSLFDINEQSVDVFLQNSANRFESHDGADLLYLNVLQFGAEGVPSSRVCFYLKKNLLLVFADNTEEILSIIHDFMDDIKKPVLFERLYYTFFERVTMNDTGFLEDLEQEIIDLEDELFSQKRRDCVKAILALRKKLMRFKRYYEQILLILDDILENENNLVEGKSMRYFRNFEGRIDRLYHMVLNLNDYLTQVRESYQNEVDISLNNIMKIFTVLTAIFLPLTLIVGWYGMNLQMPEFRWSFGYPFVMIICSAVVVISFLYFKKNNWLQK